MRRHTGQSFLASYSSANTQFIKSFRSVWRAKSVYLTVYFALTLINQSLMWINPPQRDLKFSSVFTAEAHRDVGRKIQPYDGTSKICLNPAPGSSHWIYAWTPSRAIVASLPLHFSIKRLSRGLWYSQPLRIFSMKISFPPKALINFRTADKFSVYSID